MKENRDWLEIEVFTESVLFDKLPTVFDVMEDHCESISIPEGFELLASSDECINEAMQHKDKMIYGLQFHPEVSGNFGRVIIENFVNCVDE
jgi:GMP synthase (glutamine-hydrolysing)